MNCNRRKAFTLIELLVVISIIALLLSILMPALSKVKEQARTVVCNANVKQWGVIFMLYASDNKDSFPQCVTGNGVMDKDSYWMGATMSYYNDADLRFCPSSRPDPASPFIPFTGMVPMGDPAYGETLQHWGNFGPGTITDWWDEFPEGSYGLNEWCSNPPQSVAQMWGSATSSLTWRNLNRIDRAGSVPLFLDARMVDGYPQDSNVPILNPDDPAHYYTNSINMFNMDRHGKGINSVFIDGSARKIDLKELWTLKWHPNYDTRGVWTKAGGATKAQWPDWMQGFKEY